MHSQAGKYAYEKKEAGIEFLIVFGSMQFGADALKNWGEEKFFYRTGIALKIWEEQGDRKM